MYPGADSDAKPVAAQQDRGVGVVAQNGRVSGSRSSPPFIPSQINVIFLRSVIDCLAMRSDGMQSPKNAAA